MYHTDYYTDFGKLNEISVVTWSTEEMVCYDACMNFPYHRVVIGVNDDGRRSNPTTDVRCGLVTSVNWYRTWGQGLIRNKERQCKRACSACTRFFEENLDQWLGGGSSEENCFEWNIQVSRHDLPSTPLSLSRALALLHVRVCSRIA